jgi:hypothetical protein
MTVAELIAKLSEFDGSIEVVVYDGDAGNMKPVVDAGDWHGLLALEFSDDLHTGFSLDFKGELVGHG